MKEYESISREIILDQKVFLFPKYDGSCIRAEYNKNKGFFKFGSRKKLIDRSENILGESIDLFLDKYSKDLTAIFKAKKYEMVTCYSEFFGQNSFAGRHDIEKHDIMLFDINIYKKGILGPTKFYEMFDGLNVALPILEGYLNDEIIEKIRSGTLEGQTFEGVVGKTVKDFQPEMFKIKNRAWLLKLKEQCGKNENLYKELE